MERIKAGTVLIKCRVFQIRNERLIAKFIFFPGVARDYGFP